MNPIDNIMALAHRWSLATYNKALGKEFEDFDEIQKALRTAIEQALNAQVPEGYVLVPVKPTEEMIYAAQVAGHPGDGFDVVADYEAMLAAAPQPRRNDTAGKMIAAGNRLAAMLDTSLTAPVEQWPDEAEIDAALKEWRFAVDPCPLAAAGKGIDDNALLGQALEWIEAQPEPRMIGAFKIIAAIRERLK
jgi:hypothetical protein